MQLNFLIKSLLLVCLIGSSVSFADCAKNVQPIQEGQPAQCSGFLFSDGAEREASTARDLVQKLQQKSDLQSKEIDIQGQRLSLYMNESLVLSKERAQHENTKDLNNLFYFTLGVVATAILANHVR